MKSWREAEVDKISSLPDLVRSLIVSYLPTEDAVRTSILSKQWRYLSVSLPNLDFDQVRFEGLRWGTNRFKKFVCTILSCHDKSDIDNFRLHVSWFLNTKDLNDWISFAADHRVRKFSLLVSPKFNFQCSNFNFTNLTLLSLSSARICLPTVFNLPLLQNLILNYVIFSSSPYEEDEDNTDENQIFSVETGLFTCNCPMLRTFSLSNAILKHFNTLTILVSNATAVKMVHVRSNVGIKFKLCIPNLCEMMYKGDFPPDLNAETMSSLRTLLISFTSPPWNDSSGVSTHDLLMALHNVTELFLGDYVVELLTQDQGLSATLPTSYPKLKFLSLHITPVKNHVLVSCLLLRRVPNLQSLFIQIQECDTSFNMHDMESHWKTKEFPRGKLKLLKEATFYGFTGSEVELEIVRYILEKASILKTLKISYSMRNEISKECYIRTSNKITRFTKDSPHVTIKQYHSSA